MLIVRDYQSLPLLGVLASDLAVDTFIFNKLLYWRIFNHESLNLHEIEHIFVLYFEYNIISDTL